VDFGVPGPATTSTLLARMQPLDDDLSSPWACVPCSPAFRATDHDLRLSFHPLTTPAVSPADTLTELGLCSLAPAAFFEARLTSVFETRCRLPTSATT